LGVGVRTVQKWCGRFRATPKMAALEDEPRSGRPPRVTLATRCQLLKLACSKPEAAGAKFRDVWSYAALADSLEKTCGERLSRSEIGVILREAEIRPHRVRYWLHSPDPDFAAKVDRLCALYLRPPKGATVLCIDEKTCIQALDRPRPLVGARRGRVGRFDYEYRRRGTTNLLAALEPRTGRIFGRCTRRRTAIDLLHFMEEVAARYPGVVYVVWDNLNIHHGAPWKAFNRRHGGRFRFVYTPLHASWMNQVEVWFGILQRRVLRYGVFPALRDLKARITGFLAHWNARETKPFRWTLRPGGCTMTTRRAS
jgi:transposase